MHSIWKRKRWVLLAAGLVLAAALTERVWGLTDFWRTASRQETVIVLDAGHGGSDPGAVSEMLVEKDLNLAIALKLQGYLEEAGYTVLVTRLDDSDLASESSGGTRKQADMRARREIMEESGADLMISIHQNAFPDARYWGPQVFYQKQSTEAAALALLVQAEMNAFTAPGNTREAKANDSYYILKEAPMPAILVECGFITNSREAENLRDESYQKKVAWGIYSGIEKYLQSDVF